MSLLYVFLLGSFIAPGLVILATKTSINVTVALFYACRALVQMVRYVYYRRRAKGVIVGCFTLLVGSGLLSSQSAIAGEVRCIDWKPAYLEAYQITQAGQPGLVFVGVHNPSETVAYFLTPKGWILHEAGLYPPYMRYDNGLPAAQSIQVELPSTNGSTPDWAGWTIYVGHGVLTPEGMDLVKSRREALNEIKPQRVAEGKWNSRYDSDDQFKWALVQKNMIDNNTYQKSVPIIPQITCDPPESGR